MPASTAVAIAASGLPCVERRLGESSTPAGVMRKALYFYYLNN